MPYPSDTQLRTAPPIKDGLDAFTRDFKTSCDSLGIARPFDPATLEQHKDFKDLLINFVFALQNLPASSHLPATFGQGTFRNDLRRFISVVDSEEVEIQRIIPLLNAVLDAEGDEIIWRKAYAVVVESTPPPRPLPFLGQTPYLHTTSSFVNSSEHRRYVDTVLKGELGSIYIDVQNFAEVFFGDINGIEATSAMIMRRCTEGDKPLYKNSSGWRDWPPSTQEKEVLLWLTRTVNLFREYLGESDLDYGSFEDRTILAQPSQPLQGSIASRKLDAAIVRHEQTKPQQRMHWSQVLVPGELKSNPDLDTISKTWCDLGRYVREVLTAQESRRYVLGFTLCGSIMRLWEFDRAGAIASEPFDIQQDALKFVSTLVGYLMMNDKQLGYDPSIKSSPDGTRFIEITRNGNPERLILDELMKRSSCVAGRATTCWKAHREGSEGKEVLVVKDSWQIPERDEEGALLKEALDHKVTNIARYYFHETVYIDGDPDDTLAGIRRGIDLSKAKFHQERSNTSTAQAGRKRSSTHISSDAALPSTKRSCSNSRSKAGCSTIVQSRVHRRVIVQDYGKPLHKATSLSAMLAAMEGCLQGYQSLYTKTGLLQGDISIGNLLMNETTGFLIDLDPAIREKRDRPSGAHGKTGTRAFMPIGQLLGDELSFVHGLESFFWVLFWICIHFNGPNDTGRVVKGFDEWNYISMEDLAKLKLGTVSDDDIFEATMAKFTEYHKPLKRWVDLYNARSFELVLDLSCLQRDDYMRITETICKFIQQVPKLEELYLMLPEPFDWAALTSTISSRSFDLSCFVMHHLVDRGGQDLVDGGIPLPSHLEQVLQGRQLACYGCSTPPGELASQLRQMQPRPSFKLLHIRASGVVLEKLSSHEQPSWSSAQLYKYRYGDDPPYGPDDIFEFAKWAFSDDGLPNLAVLAWGDFSYEGRYSRFSALLGRSSNGYRPLTSADVSLWDLVQNNMDMLASCPLDDIMG